MSDVLDALIEEYKVLREKEDAEQLELVKLEHRIWDQLKLDEGRGFTKTAVGERRDWFHKKFGGRVSDYEARASVFNAGSWAHHLLDHVDKGFFSLTAAARTVRVTKELARTYQIDFDIALKQALSNRGKRRKKQVGEPSILPDVDTTFGSSATVNSKEYMRRINVLTAAFIDAAFKDTYIDPFYKNKITADFKDSLDLIVKELRGAISSVKQITKDDGIEEIGRSSFHWACEVLGLRHAFGDEVNLQVAKRRKNARALALHPDRNPDNPKAAEELESVLDAFRIIESYVRRHNRRKPNAKN